MGNVLAVCEFTADGLRSSALANLSFARQAAELHGGKVEILLIGEGAKAAAAEAGKFAPVVVVADNASLGNYMAETHAPIVAEAAKSRGASVVCATATAVGKDLVPRVAALLDAGMASDISAIISKNQFQRPILAGNAFVGVEIGSAIICVTPRQSEFDSAPELGGESSIEELAVGDVDALGAEFVRLDGSSSDRPDLNDADIVVSGGRGMANGENFKHLEELADLLGAAMGASRAATDAGFVPADWQVGQTGKIVAPDLYFAVGISGAIQHLAGMKGSKTIVAINTNPEAPIFEVADYGVVTSWEEALPVLVAEIKKLKESQT